jgi:hypothetical protein
MVGLSRLRAMPKAPVWSTRRYQVRLRHGSALGAAAATGGRRGGAGGGRGGTGAAGGAVPAAGLSEEEALRRAIEESELAELGNWEGLGAQLAASAFTSRGGASSSGAGPFSIHAGASSSHHAPSPPPPTAEPQPWGYIVLESPPRAPPIQVNWGHRAMAEPQTPPPTPPQQPLQAPASAPQAPGVLMVPWPFPWDPPPIVDLTGDDD